MKDNKNQPKPWNGITAAFLLFSSTYYGDHARGWHWYEFIQPDSDFESPPVENPIQAVETLRFNLKQALDQAILKPSMQNVKKYIELQNQMSSQAGLFANMWQKVLLFYPQLNYSLLHPTNHLGRMIDLDRQQKQEDQAIHQLAQTSGLFFFYRSTCPYCQRFSPIVKTFAHQYNLAVIPITTDGISLPEFPSSQIDRGQAEIFNVTMEPALFTVDPLNRRIDLIGYGLMSESELRARILEIANEIKIRETSTA